MQIKETEKETQKAILDYLKLKGAVALKFPSVGIIKPNGSYITARDRGISDIIACYKGKFVAIEVKSEKYNGKLTVEQIDFLDRVNRAGGHSVCVHTLSEAILFIDNFSTTE